MEVPPCVDFLKYERDESGGGSPAPAKLAETPGSGLQDALLPPNSTLLVLGAGAPLALARLADGHPGLPGSPSPQQLATQVAAEWGLPTLSSECQMDHRAGRDPLLCAACLAGSQHPWAGLLPGAPGPALELPGSVLSTCKHQDFQVLCSRKAVSSEP